MGGRRPARLGPLTAKRPGAWGSAGRGCPGQLLLRPGHGQLVTLGKEMGRLLEISDYPMEINKS